MPKKSGVSRLKNVRKKPISSRKIHQRLFPKRPGIIARKHIKKIVAHVKFRLPTVRGHFLHQFKSKRIHLPTSYDIRKSRKSLQKTIRITHKRIIAAPQLTVVSLKSAFIRHKAFIVSTISISIVLGGTVYWFVLQDIPSPYRLSSAQSPLTSIIRDRNGLILYKVYKNANRVKLTWDEIPPIVKNATIAIEDADFYQHHGISAKSILRAFLFNIRQSDINTYQGGSTITQQLVKNKLLNQQKTYKRKIQEVILAIASDLLYSKKDILTMYLNEVGYGGPAHGVQAAAQMYFGIDAKDVTLAQAAFLTGLPAAPTTFSPFGTNSNLATIRQHQVLERMFHLGMIKKDQYSQALSEELVFAPQKIDILAPHFVMFVKDQLVNQFGEDLVEQGGLDVTTTLDYTIQEKAESIVKKQIDAMSTGLKIQNGASLITTPSTGEILAMVGSQDYFDVAHKGYVNVTTSLRQPGSSIKPVNYSYAFDHGFTPNNVIEDSPVVYIAPGSTERYAPQNYDSKFHGNVTIRSALANSYNIPAVKILNKIGVDNMLEQGRKMGIKSWNDNPPIGLSLTLGGLEVTMLDMARAYGTLANGGVKKELHFIKEIRDSNQKDLTSVFYDTSKDVSLIGSVEAAENTQVVSPLAAYWITDILSDNIARLPAFGPYAKLTIPNHKVAVKTGTSNNFRDNWTIGYTPDYLVATWVGNSDGTYMNKNLVSGITGAAPIWNEIMSSLIAEAAPKEFPVPQGLIPVKICAVNGLLTCPNCPQEKTEYFTADKVPTKQCYFRSKAECDGAKAQSEGKSDEEKKQILAGCSLAN